MIEIGARLKKVPTQRIQHFRGAPTVEALSRNDLSLEKGGSRSQTEESSGSISDIAQGSKGAAPISDNAKSRLVLRSGEECYFSGPPTCNIERIHLNHQTMCEGRNEENLEGWENNVDNDEEELRGFDLSRLPPRVYVTLRAAREAIRTELFGLLGVPSGETPALEIVDTRAERYRKVDEIRMTLLAKLKAGHRPKSRL